MVNTRITLRAQLEQVQFVQHFHAFMSCSGDVEGRVELRVIGFDLVLRLTVMGTIRRLSPLNRNRRSIDRGKCNFSTLVPLAQGQAIKCNYFHWAQGLADPSQVSIFHPLCGRSDISPW